MGDTTHIGWCNRQLPDGTILPGKTFNPWIGCQKVSSACLYCYAEAQAIRWGWNVFGTRNTTVRRVTTAKNWSDVLKWNMGAQILKHRLSVFCCSLADVFEHNPQSELDLPRSWLWPLIEQTRWLNWLLLTKRPGNIKSMVPGHWREHGCPDNVWLGTSAGTQFDANLSIPKLFEVRACQYFVSYEPALEHVDFTPWLNRNRLTWIIGGGESGAHHRPFDLDWMRSARDQCQAYGVPFFFKQVGGLRPTSGGRLLDGRTWDEMPPEYPEKYAVEPESVTIVTQ